MKPPLPAMEYHFFSEGVAWSLALNTTRERRGLSLLRERKLIASITGQEWRGLEQAVCESADSGNLGALSELLVGSLVNGSEILPVPVRERLAGLTARYLESAFSAGP